MSEQQDIQNQLLHLAIETKVMSLIMIHLLSREAKGSGEPDEWLRHFADEVLSSIDRASNPPPDILRLIEETRTCLDHIMNAVRVRLTK
jgi:hypothetical protein